MNLLVFIYQCIFLEWSIGVAEFENLIIIDLNFNIVKEVTKG